MDLLISKPFQLSCLAWHGSNKAVSLSFNRHRSGRLLDNLQVNHANGSRFAFTLGTLHFCNDSLHISIHGTTFPLGVSVTLELGLPFVFTMFLQSLLHPPRALLSRYKRCLNKVSNLKIYRWFCSHCLHVYIHMLVNWPHLLCSNSAVFCSCQGLGLEMLRHCSFQLRCFCLFCTRSIAYLICSSLCVFPFAFLYTRIIVLLLPLFVPF